MKYRPKDLQAFDAKMKEINATKETDLNILRHMIEMERNLADEIQSKLVEENEYLKGHIRELEAECKALQNCVEELHRTTSPTEKPL